jgi:hypothetical protein
MAWHGWRQGDFIICGIGLMPYRPIIAAVQQAYLPAGTKGRRPLGNRRVPMKKLVLTTLTVLSLIGAVAPLAHASSTEDLSAATRMQQTGAYTR